MTAPAVAEDFSFLSHHLRAEAEKAETHLTKVVEVAEQVAQLDSVQVVTALCGVKRVASLAKDAEEVLKAEVKGRHQPRGDDGQPLNQKVFVDGENGARIELRPKVTAKFDEATAAIVLQAKGLYADACDTETVITDPQALFNKLKEAQQLIASALGDSTFANEIDAVVKASVTERSTLNQDKILALVKLGKLTVEETTGLFAKKVDHSVYDVSK